MGAAPNLLTVEDDLHSARPGDESDEGTPRTPLGNWTLERPEAAALLFVVGALAGGVFATGAIRGIAHGRGSGPLVAIAVFWILGLVANVSGLVRAVRTIRDPQGEAARREELRVRVLAQPRAQLMRKAALGVALICAVPVSMGVVFIVAGGGLVVVGWLLVLLGVGVGLFLVIRAWRYPHI